MGLGTVLSTATQGLSVTQTSLDVVARNIANAGTPGYTRKTVGQSNTIATGGVHSLDVQRTVDAFLQSRLRTESSGFANVDVRKQFLDRIDAIFGTPGDANALDTIVNQFSQSLQQLTTSPESFTSRQAVLSAADTLANQLRSLSGQVQDLRQLAEDSIGAAVDDVNGILSNLAELNDQFTVSSGSGIPPADLLDQRDRLLGRLSQYLDVRVTEASNGTVNVATQSGISLVDVGAATLRFDGQATVNATQLYSSDPDTRGVGTLTIEGANGSSVDLIQGGGALSGKLGAYIELRDKTLPQVQAQLDELAHGLALSLSSKVTAGAAASAGGKTGFDLNLQDFKPGDRITLSYRQTPPGADKTVTFIRVDDPSALPLSDDATAETRDRVVGIDFSGGTASAAASIQAALGGAFTVSNPSGSSLRILDDGAPNTIDIASLSSTVASSGAQDGDPALPLFVDAAVGGVPYTGSFDGGSQKLGFASRIGVNPAVLSDNELLVRYQGSPETPLGDATRPLQLLSRLSDSNFTFSASTGIGQTSRPFSGSVASFARSVVSFQAGQADRVTNEHSAKELIVNELQDRYDDDTGVDVDGELSQLITLQNAYAANARVIQVASEMIKLLLQL